MNNVIISYDFYKDGLEFTLTSNHNAETITVSAVGHKTREVSTTESDWPAKVMKNLFIIDPDCILDATDEMKLKGFLIKSVPEKAQITGFNIIL